MGGDLIITGGVPLNGTVRIPAAKNSVLPLLAASLLCSGTVRLLAVPQLADVDTSLVLLRGAGCAARWQGSDITVQGMPSVCRLEPEAAAQMRASILFCAPLLARLGRVETVLPGGCRIGARPIDLHLSGLAQMGAHCCEEGIRLILTAPAGLHGADITLGFPSVGATETLLLAAVCAQGETVLRGAAREPEIVDLAQYLNQCGARIYGAGESCVIVEGVSALSGSEYTVMPDRIVAATYMAAAAVTGGTVLLKKVNGSHLLPVLSAFEEAGCRVMQSGDELLIRAPERLKPVRHVRTMPYPGFPTDAQAPVMTMAALGDGTSIFVENIFESRYKHAGELNRLGAKIKVEGKVAVIEGVPALSGAPVTAQDLRGGAALVAAGLAAQGETQIMHPEYIDRGYERFEENLRRLGAEIYRI